MREELEARKNRKTRATGKPKEQENRKNREKENTGFVKLNRKMKEKTE